MAWIDWIDPEETKNNELQDLYDQVTDPVTGNVDNIMKIHSLHPEGMDAHWKLYRTVMTGTETLRKKDREMIALVVSVMNECEY